LPQTRQAGHYQQRILTQRQNNMTLAFNEFGISALEPNVAPKAWAAQRLMITGEQNKTAADPVVWHSDNTSRAQRFLSAKARYRQQGVPTDTTTNRPPAVQATSGPTQPMRNLTLLVTRSDRPEPILSHKGQACRHLHEHQRMRPQNRIEPGPWFITANNAADGALAASRLWQPEIQWKDRRLSPNTPAAACPLRRPARGPTAGTSANLDRRSPSSSVTVTP